MMLFSQQPPEETTLSARKLLSMQDDTWGSRRNDYYEDTVSLCGLSLDTKDVDNAVSPFDDIGYLASGVRTSGSIRMERKIKEESLSAKTTTKGPSLGNFLDSSKRSDDITPLQEIQEEVPRHGRLEKSLCGGGELSDDQSLGLSALQPPPEKVKGKTNWFDMSKHSLALSALVTSKSSSKNKSTRNLDMSRHSLGLSALGSSKHSSKNKIKNHDLSRASFGLSGLGSSKQTKEQQEMIDNLRAENEEHSSENERLKAQLAKMSESLERLESLQEWRSFGELINVTMEMCQAKTQCEQANLEMSQIQSELKNYEKEFEDFFLNRENEKKSQDRRIAFLEVKCLQNGIAISQDTPLRGEGQGKDKLVLNNSENGCQNEESVTSFGEESIEDEEEEEELGGGDTLGNALGKLNQSGEKLLKHMDGLQEELSVSEFTKLSGDTTINSTRSTPASQPKSKPDSWLTLDEEASPFNVETFKIPAKNADNIRGVGLEEYLHTKIEASHNKSQDLETDTWAPHSVVEDALGKNSVQSDPIPPPPPPPPVQRVQSAPAPSGRKRHKSPGHRPGRSKSPGIRRKLKDCRLSDISAVKPAYDLPPPPPPDESMNEPSPVDRGRRKKTLPKSPGNRRKQKESKIGETPIAIVEPELGALSASLSNAPPGTRRKFKANSSVLGKCPSDSAVRSRSVGRRSTSSFSKNSLDRASSHSISRRRDRANSDFDRLTVIGALHKALQIDVDSGDAILNPTPGTKSRTPPSPATKSRTPPPPSTHKSSRKKSSTALLNNRWPSSSEGVGDANGAEDDRHPNCSNDAPPRSRPEDPAMGQGPLTDKPIIKIKIK